MTLACPTAVLIRYKAELTVDEAIFQLSTRRHYNVIITENLDCQQNNKHTSIFLKYFLGDAYFGSIFQQFYLYNILYTELVAFIFTARCMMMMMMMMHYSAKRGTAIACRLSVRLSVCDVGGSGSHRSEILETNCRDT